MQLPLLTFSVLLQRMAASVQGAATALVDLSIGSVLRACLEASAAIALWLQWLILQVLALTRASTSNGRDLDSWMADFSFTRLPGAQAAGIVTFARYTPGLQALIPLGAVVRTTDGSLSFSVIEQSSNPAWNGSSGYTLAANAVSVDLPVQAGQSGSSGNVQPFAVGLLTVPITGVDTVANQQGFSGGLDAESDLSFRLRFTAYINSRSLATSGAIREAIASVQQGLRDAVLENQDVTGAPLPGNFIVVVDDGSGFPPDSLLAAVAGAVEAVRPIGSSYGVSGPLVIPIVVQMTLETNNPATRDSVVTTVQQAVTAWIAQLPIGGTLAISKIDAIAHGCDTSVQSVLGTTIDLATSDVTAPPSGVLVAAAVTVS